ncbi:MAG: hypothetical protein WBG32_02845 [Nodosilinea sp.]
MALKRVATSSFVFSLTEGSLYLVCAADLVYDAAILRDRAFP